MRYPTPGSFRTPEAFAERLRELGIDLPMDEEIRPGGPLAAPIELLGRRLPNRFCAHPMEGWDGMADGGPTERTLRRWRRFGRSGAALIWGGEAFAVDPAGRANPAQLCSNADSEAQLRLLIDHMAKGRRDIGGDPDSMLFGLQLTHSGRFSNPDGTRRPLLAQRHPVLDAKYGLDPGLPLATDGELEGIGERMVEAAVLAQRAGFQFVDIKCCHGYLLHELLGARERPGPHGGDLDGRSRLLLSVIDAVKAACPGLGIGVRLSVADLPPFRRGEDGIGEPIPQEGFEPWRHHFGISRDDPLAFDLAEPIELLRRLRDRGVFAVNATLGSPYYNPHLQRPAAYPPSDGYISPQDPLVFVEKHLRAQREVKRAVPGLPLVGTGYTYLQDHVLHVAQRVLAEGWTDFVGLGRMLLAYPELPADALAGKKPDRRRICRTFSDCTSGPRNGLPSGCYPLDPFYSETEEALRLAEIRKGIPK
ncbi:MAG: NADH:flavin oxidoreductase [Planctomycetota bacterium]